MRPAAGAPTIHAPGGRPACKPAALQTTTDASQQNNTGSFSAVNFAQYDIMPYNMEIVS